MSALVIDSDEADAPIIVPPPGQILRRAARTKIRKQNLPGDGGGHRFGSTRRGVRTLPPTAEQCISSAFSSSDHDDTSMDADVSLQHCLTLPDDGFPVRPPDSYAEEASSIFDAYARGEEDDTLSHSLSIVSSPLSSDDSTDLRPSQEKLQSSLEPQQSRTPSPSVESSLHESPPETEMPPHSSPSQYITAPQTHEPQELPTQSQYPPQMYPSQPPLAPRKDKKGLFGKWSSDKPGKRIKDKESRERPEREKELGFFGSLFGSKKKQDADSSSSSIGSTAGREAAHALLGASKSSKNYVPSSSPGLIPGANPYARYPIHVERAIYRLSHIKLANPRRPLYEQVLISNLMFWYLGVINKAQNPTPTAQAQQNGTPGAGTESLGEGNQQTAEEAKREQRESEQREQEQRERERVEKERLEREREIEMKKKESGKRGSLTKQPAGGVRRAEMPVKGPQYEMQHRVMEQEYGNYNNMQSSQQMGRVSANGQPHARQQPQQYSNAPMSPHLMHSELSYHDSQHRLPPGAMAVTDRTWVSVNSDQRAQNPSPQRSRTPLQNRMSPPPAQRQAPSLPQDGFAGAGGRIPTRSLSANAVSVPQVNSNPKIRKGLSAHAISPSARQPEMKRPRSSEGRPGVDLDGLGEEEDTPLATLRQQQRRAM